MRKRNTVFYNWEMNEPDWEALRALRWVHRTGSLASAAEELGCAVSTVARRIDGLEQTLGLILLHRAKGGAVPTEIGEAILISVDQAAKSLDQIPRQARQFVHFKDRQVVRLSATETAINDILMPRIGVLRNQYPNLLIELESTNAHASLEFGETDLAVRLVQPKQADLVARKLAPVRIAVFISAEQLAGRNPDDVTLDGENVVWIDSGLGDIAENQLIERLGIGESITLRATSVRALALACQQNQGFAMLPVYMGKELGLIELTHISVPCREAWLVFHPETKRDPVLSSVRKWIVQCFAESSGG